jgi:hypothetical protein
MNKCGNFHKRGKFTYKMCKLCESRFRVQFNTVGSNVSDLYPAKVCFHELL